MSWLRKARKKWCEHTQNPTTEIGNNEIIRLKERETNSKWNTTSKMICVHEQREVKSVLISEFWPERNTSICYWVECAILVAFFLSLSLRLSLSLSSFCSLFLLLFSQEKIEIFEMFSVRLFLLFVFLAIWCLLLFLFYSIDINQYVEMFWTWCSDVVSFSIPIYINLLNAM